MLEDIGLLELTISTFIGFLSALLVEYLILRYQDSKELNDALKGLREELTGIVATVKGLKADSYNLDPLETPVWDSLVYGGGISNLEIQKNIIQAYRSIDRLNNWENMRTRSFFESHSSNSLLDKEVEKNREDVLRVVNRVLKNLNDIIKN